MNYAKKNFGDFDTGENPLLYNNFYAWEKNGKIIVYQRLLGSDGFINEEIYISNDEYDFKLGSFYNELEERDDGKQKVYLSTAIKSKMKQRVEEEMKRKAKDHLEIPRSSTSTTGGN